MSSKKMPYSSVPGDYDTNKLTDIHSSESTPSSYARNIKHTSNMPKSKNSFNSSDRSIKKEQISDPTERIPTLNKYSNMNSNDTDFDYKGEI